MVLYFFQFVLILICFHFLILIFIFLGARLENWVTETTSSGNNPAKLVVNFTDMVFFFFFQSY